MSDSEKLERVTTAIRTINRIHNLGDACYDVRESELSMSQQSDTVNSWNTPVMTEYGAALDVLRAEGVL